MDGVRKSCKWRGLTRDGRCVVVMKGLTKSKHRGKNPFGKMLHFKSFKNI